jgi:ABC-type phosphate transport system substrate-binding protein
MNALKIFFIATLLMGFNTAIAKDPPSAERTYVVIVHANNPINSIDRRVLANIFLKKTTRWTNNEPIRPVDLPIDSQPRVNFSKDILLRSVTAVASYWQQAIFSGRDVPPPEFKNDTDILKYVAEHRGSIGYVSRVGNNTDIKVITVEF